MKDLGYYIFACVILLFALKYLVFNKEEEEVTHKGLIENEEGETINTKRIIQWSRFLIIGNIICLYVLSVTDGNSLVYIFSLTYAFVCVLFSSVGLNSESGEQKGNIISLITVHGIFFILILIWGGYVGYLSLLSY